VASWPCITRRAWCGCKPSVHACLLTSSSTPTCTHKRTCKCTRTCTHTCPHPCPAPQVMQGQLYTSLATGRINALTEELVVLQQQRQDAISLAQNLEKAQVCGFVFACAGLCGCKCGCGCGTKMGEKTAPTPRVKQQLMFRPLKAAPPLHPSTCRSARPSARSRRRWSRMC